MKKGSLENKKRPTVQEMEELYKKRYISTRNEEALKNLE
jgi:hypothetical protein